MSEFCCLAPGAIYIFGVCHATCQIGKRYASAYPRKQNRKFVSCFLSFNPFLVQILDAFDEQVEQNEKVEAAQALFSCLDDPDCFWSIAALQLSQLMQDTIQYRFLSAYFQFPAECSLR